MANQTAVEGDNIIDFEARRGQSRQALLSRLYRQHRVALRAFLHRRRLPDSDIDDICQEVFAKLAKMDGLETRILPDISAQKVFILTMANNHLVDMERHKVVRHRYLNREKQDQKADYRQPANNPENIAANHQDIDRIKTVIAGLRPSWRQAFVLSRYRCLTYPQIAREMSISVKLVEKYIRNALIQIREALRKSHGGIE